MRKKVMELKNVTKTYQMGDVKVHAMRGVDLSIYDGEMASIVGPSGSGKSTIMHILGLLDVPTSGKVFIDGKDATALGNDEAARLRGDKIGFVFQVFYLIPSITALDNVAVPMMFYDVPEEKRRKLAKLALEKLGMGHRTTHLPSELSGGERQRVAIARALMNDPAVILADEPTGNLDSKSGRDVLRVFKKLNKEGKTIVVVTHDESIAKHAERIIRIKDGSIEKIEVRK